MLSIRQRNCSGLLAVVFLRIIAIVMNTGQLSEVRSKVCLRSRLLRLVPYLTNPVAVSALEHVLRAIADTSHGLDEKQTVAELFGAKSQQLFAPAFDKTSQRAKTSSPISKLRRKFQNLLNQDPFPNEMNQYVMQFLTEFATDGADVLAYAFEPLQRFEFPALFEEDLTDPGRVDAANDLWRRTHKLSKKLCRYFKDPQNVEV